MSSGHKINNGIIAGIDGCKEGWLCLTKNLETGNIDSKIIHHIKELLEINPKPIVVMIDIPIGLPDNGTRKCDCQARSRLGPPRSSSVFSAPIRPMLEAGDYPAACEIGRNIDGRALTKQTYSILKKIREVDSFLLSDPTYPQWIREVHPEVSFWAWNINTAMVNRKKTAAGRIEREQLVNSKYGNAYATAQANLPRGQYANDDLLDAFAALWSAERVVSNNATILPDNPTIDSCGLRMEMVV